MSRSTIMRTIRSLLNCLKASTFLIAFFIVVFNTSLSAQGQAPGTAKKTFTIVIDPGHGGKDPGAVGKVSKEKDIALAIAKKTGSYISGLMTDVNVLYTRSTDEYIGLYERADYAKENKADLFLSIHVNGNNKSTVYGAETYVMGLSKSERNFELAMKENSVILLEDDRSKYEGFNPKNSEDYIQFSLMRNSFLNQSLLMASEVQEQLRVRAKRKDGGVRQGPFLVLWRTTMPSVLVETGYISNREEEKYLITDYGQDVIASAIYRAFRNYKEETEERAATRAADIAAADKEKIQLPKTNSTNTEQIEPKTKVEKKIISASEKVINPVEKKATESVEKKVEASKNTKTEGPVYRVQVIAAKTPIKPGSKYFQGETNLEEIFMEGYYKYMTAPLSTYSQAQELRNSLSAKFPGAFIVPFMNGKKISLKKAISLEKL